MIGAAGTLPGTLNHWRRTPWQPGRHDCIMAVCGHVLRVTGIDPAVPWRGTYDDEAGGDAICAAYGGVYCLMALGMELAGFPPSHQPGPGQPIVARLGGIEVAGLTTPRGVAFATRGENGRGRVLECRAPIVGAWALCRR